jgi:hypothetical protein
MYVLKQLIFTRRLIALLYSHSYALLFTSVYSLERRALTKISFIRTRFEALTAVTKENAVCIERVLRFTQNLDSATSQKTAFFIFYSPRFSIK